MKWIGSEDKINLFNLLILHGPLFYLSLGAAMGMSYAEEKSAGPFYKVYMVLLFLLGLFPVLKMFLRNQCTSKIIWPFLIISLYILFAYLQLSTSDSGFLLQLVCFGVPAVCVAISMDKKQGLVGMLKWFDLTLPILAFSFIFLIKELMVIKMMGDVAYGQSTSYFAAYCFTVDVFLIRYKDLYPKFEFLDKKWYQIVRILLLPYFFVICIFAGGRGASVLLFICVFYNFGLIKRVSVKNIWKYFLTGMLVLALVVFVIGKIADDYYDILLANYDRISALFEGGRIDTSASSGRDNIWLDALKIWEDSPLFGYGLFSYLDFFYIRPHNVFLEILLQGGIVLLMIFIIVLIRTFFKYRTMLRKDRKQIFLMPFILYLSTVLMFSGSYWMETLFWFILTYIYSYNCKRVEIVKAAN